MFSKEVPSIIFLGFTLISIFVDIKYFWRQNREKRYNRFELHVGSYADLAFLFSLFLVIYSFFGNNINTIVTLYLANFFLALIYVAVFKSFLQLFVGWRYTWVDTMRERVGMLKVIANRVSIFIFYILLSLFFRHLATHLYQGISGNVVCILFVIVLSRVVSHKCNKINVKLKREEEC